jgi:YHS domain-containing protein
MIKLGKIVILLGIVSFVLVFSALADQQAEETVKCPVSGKEMKKSEARASVEYEGKTYYFCCENCKKEFMENPQKYTEGETETEHMHAHMHGEEMAVDPVCEMKISMEDAKATHRHKGKTYYFCTEACREKFVKDPEKYIKNIGDMMTCPVSGEKISKSEAAESYEYEGKTYYFCCAGCKEKFIENPEKYIKEK